MTKTEKMIKHIMNKENVKANKELEEILKNKVASKIAKTLNIK